MPDRNERISNNLGLARSCVNRYLGKGIEYDDLYQTACIGLVKAVDSFDESRGVCFSTYAVPVILGEIRQLFRREGTVKVSRGLKELAMKASVENERFMAMHDRQPSVSELAERMEVSAEELTLAVCAAQRPVSLTAQSEEDEERQIDIATEPFDDKVIELTALREAVKKLSSDDRRLIRERYMNRHTQTVTAGLMGMTQVQVSRRESKIIKELRRMMDG